MGGESRSRAEQARIAFALGHHAEIYSDLDELLEQPPREGIIFAADDSRAGDAQRSIERLGEHGIWLPVVFVANDPEIDRVVAAMKAGALHYLQLPFEMGIFARRLATILAEAEQHGARRRREVEARHDIALLSRREREVLELLSGGCSNKEIARQLAISPRTVEIHRGNMMAKLGAGHPADAVRLWVDAQQAAGMPSELPESPEPVEECPVAGRIGDRRTPAPDPLRRRVQRQ
ncbi:MAG TPA: LuxR C-terminal-related transcriptional regulator [Croceibacterium sp.]